MTTMTTNEQGFWVPVIPWAVHNLRHKCHCGRAYWTKEGYRGHYALTHILGDGE